MTDETENPILELENQQVAFAEYVVSGMTQRQAYKKAGFLTEATENIDSNASKLASQEKVKAYIDQRRIETSLRAQYQTGITVERTMRELGRIAFLDPAEIFDKDGNLLHLKDMPVYVRAAVASVEFEKLFEGKGKSREYVGDVIKIKFWNKVDSLDKLCKIQAMYAAEKVEVNHTFEAMLSQLKPSNN